MKKYLILFAMFLVMPAYAMCPVEDGAAVCSLPGFREQVSPIYNPKTNINEFSGTPEARLRPIDRSDIGQQIREFAPAESDYSYNSSCQFGVCMQTEAHRCSSSLNNKKEGIRPLFYYSIFFLIFSFALSISLILFSIVETCFFRAFLSVLTSLY